MKYIISLSIAFALMSCSSDKSPSTIDDQPQTPNSDSVLSCANAPQGEDRITKVVSGNLYSCAIQRGKVLCWGHFALKKPPQIENVTKISASYSRACAMNSRSVKCWGDDNSGQLTVPKEITSPSDIAVGKSHICAINNFKVTCWGKNNLDELAIPQNLKNPRELQAGDSETCVRTDEGIRCWGKGLRCIDMGPEIRCEDGPNALTEEQINKFISRIPQTASYALGNYNLCYIEDQKVTCLRKTKIPQNLRNPTQIYLSNVEGEEICAKTDDGIECVLATIDDGSYIKHPKDLVNITSIGLGRGHACAAANGEVRCWGYSTNEYDANRAPLALHPCHTDDMINPSIPDDPYEGKQCSPQLSDSFCSGYRFVGKTCESVSGVGICRSTGHLGPGNLPGCKCQLN